MKQILANPSQLGQILRSARRARKLTQSEAASRIGVSQSRLSAMELDASSVTATQLLALMALYGLELVLRDKSAAPATQVEW